MRLLPLLVFLLFSPTLLVAEEISQDKAIANYLYNFATYINWPPSNNGTFSIHIISSDTNLERNIRRTLSGQTLKGKNIEVTRSSDVSVPSGINVVFMEKGMSGSYQQVYKQTEGKRVLLVSYGYANKRLVMINLTESANGRLRFEINKANILNQGLEIDPKIILLGGTELDVAQLYKTAKDSLLHKEEELDSIKEKVASLGKEIKNRETLLEAARKKTEQFKIDADTLKAEALSLKKTLDLQKEELNKERAKLATVQASLDETKKKFELAEQEYQKRKEDIAQKEKILSELTTQVQKEKGHLAELEKNVKEQDTLLEARDQTISHQKTYIQIVSVFAAIFLFLVAAIAILLRREHRTNVKLVEAQAMLVNQAKMAQMGEMLTMIAHHWRQPLNRIGVIVQNIQDDYLFGEMEKTKLQKRIEDVMEILGDISSTINRFSAAVAQNEQKYSFDPCEEVQNILNLFHPEFDSLFISVEVRTISGVTLLGDSIQFGEVFSNLFKNAKEALTSKKDTDKERKIIVDFQKHNKELEISVWDNGEPISQQLLSRVFEPFFTTKDITKKTGLGLYSAKLVIEQQFNGSIQVINIDNGVKCIIKIPMDGI